MKYNFHIHHIHWFMQKLVILYCFTSFIYLWYIFCYLAGSKNLDNLSSCYLNVQSVLPKNQHINCSINLINCSINLINCSIIQFINQSTNQWTINESTNEWFGDCSWSPSSQFFQFISQSTNQLMNNQWINQWMIWWLFLKSIVIILPLPSTVFARILLILWPAK